MEVKTAQEEVNNKIGEMLSSSRKLEHDSVNIPIVWAQNAHDVLDLTKKFQETFKIDYLSDITAYDNQDGVDGPKRFVVVYQFYSTEKKIRIRMKLGLDDGEPAVTMTTLWNAANWLEREVWDLYGIPFAGHPNLRRIMMDERFVGHPLRKEYPLKQLQPFPDSPRIHLGPNPLTKEKNL